MRTREFIVRLANGEFSKNDILQYAASVPDVSDLYWELWFSMYAVPEGFTKPIVEEYKHKYITNAMQILVTKYGYDDLVQPEAKESKRYDDLVQPEAKESKRYDDLVQPEAKESKQPKQAKPKRGRPVKTLADIMLNDDAGEKLKKLHTLVDGKKGKDLALIILACVKQGYMTKPTYQQLANEFGDIGSRQAYTNYSNEIKFTKSEIGGAIKAVKDVMQE